MRERKGCMGETDHIMDKQAFLAAHGWSGADVAPLTPDASFRTYARLTRGDESRMLMTAPPAQENLPAYLQITEHLRGLGLRVPKVDASDTAAGLALIEDFGDATFTRLLKAGADERALYLLATDVLRVLHAHEGATAIDLPPYDMAALMREVDLFIDWFVPAVRGTDVTDAEREAYHAAWASALATVAANRSALVLRDYHVDNLMVVGEGALTDIGACGLLDYQDALIGSPAYDLVSLVEDARRDIASDIRAAVLEHYFEGMAAKDRAAFEADMALLGAQRHAKVAGIFVRLSRRDGKDIYLVHVPRVLALLERCLETPALQAVRDVIEEIVPGYRALPLQS
ncbi:aminoglycoside phosphotransferase family protein [Kordiimonas marina]|uniref:aminoglycoside phosphotransferase family protein n=1 Tax=Kordiimonas marina TaxID=2872312 RepID=UPI001FF43F62|nr:phosphotransferase [Kordiimonas marina]MCJ9429515.1 phosphotransferase [Kordiimonas marina]